jgi:predicted dehydrogenase
MTQRSVLVVGAGVIGHRHMQAATQFGERISAVADGDRARAEAAAAHYDAQPFSTMAEALGALTPDIVVIATPSTQHQAQSIEALASGAHVLVEKPHRVPADDAALLAEAVAAATGRYAVGMTTRHWPGVRAAASAVASGELGSVLSYTDRMHFALEPDALAPWYFDPAVSGGGVLLTNGVHAIDRARAILGADLSVLTSRLVTVFPTHGVEDSAELRLVTPEGIPVDLSMLWSPAAPHSTGLTITGTDGFAHVDMDGSWLVLGREGERRGGAVTDQEPFDLQWASFAAGEAGFGFDDLEPSLALIEQCYREVSP